MTHTSPVATDTPEALAIDAATLLLGDSAQMHELREVIARVARTDVNVLVTGETGTGKELVARSMHQQSPRHDGAFVAINCAAIPAALLESEFFGYEKGAFTGATSSRAGRLEMARGGTLFLDEIGDMPLELQAKLLRVLQERTFERVGGARTLPVECRIVAATHADLRAAIAQGKFREDLFYRLNVLPVHIAPLRERKADIAPIIGHARARAHALHGSAFELDDAAHLALEQHDWPGNVRELVNVVERLAILFADRSVGAQDLQPHLQRRALRAPPADASPAAAAEALGAGESRPRSLDLRAAVADLEVRLIDEALAASGGVVARAAALLRIPRTTLIEKLQKLREVRRDDDEAQEVLHVGGSLRPAPGLPGHRAPVGAERRAQVGVDRWRTPALSAR